MEFEDISNLDIKIDFDNDFLDAEENKGNDNNNYMLSDNDFEGKVPKKNKKMLESINSNVNQFLNEFNEYFHQNVFQKFTGKIESLLEEKYKKFMEVSKNYNNQIKEMEFLANTDDNQHSDSLKDIISSLREEQQSQIDLIEDQYGNLIKDAYNNFRYGFKNTEGVKIVEEKFKLGIYNVINEKFTQP